jgi:hypothetical protein
VIKPVIKPEIKPEIEPEIEQVIKLESEQIESVEDVDSKDLVKKMQTTDFVNDTDYIKVELNNQ